MISRFCLVLMLIASNVTQAANTTPPPAPAAPYSPFNPNDRAAQCSSAKNAMQTAGSTFSTACGKAKMSNKNKDFEYCSADILKCRSCVDGSDSTSIPPGITCNDVKSSSKDSDSSAKDSASKSEYIKVTPDAESTKGEFANCPSLAGEDMKNYIQEVRESQTKVHELTDKVSKAQEEQQALKDDLNVKIEEIETSAQEKSQAAQDAVQKYKEELVDAQTQMLDDIQKLNVQVTEIVAKEGQVRIQKDANQEKYNEMVTTEQLKCHGTALTKVDALRNSRLAAQDAGTYTAGNFNNLLQGVGLDTRSKSQLLAQQYYLWCLQDQSYRAQISTGLEQKRISDKSADAQIVAYDNQIKGINAQITTIQTTKLDTANQKVSAQIQRTQSKLTTDLQTLQKKESNIRQTNATKAAAKDREIANLNQQLAEEKDYLKQKQDYLALKNKYGAGAMSDANAYSDASAAMDSYVGAVRTYYSSCCNDIKQDPTCDQKSNFVCGKVDQTADCLGKPGNQSLYDSTTTPPATTAPTTPAAAPANDAPATTPASARPHGRQNGGRRPSSSSDSVQ